MTSAQILLRSSHTLLPATLSLRVAGRRRRMSARVVRALQIHLLSKLPRWAEQQRQRTMRGDAHSVLRNPEIIAAAYVDECELILRSRNVTLELQTGLAAR